MPIEAIGYDVFNTLIELVPDFDEPNPVVTRLDIDPALYAQAAKPYDEDLENGFEVGLGAHARMARILDDLGLQARQSEVEPLVQAERDWVCRRFRLIDGAKDAITEIGQNHTQALCSNTTPYGVALMSRLGLLDIVDGRAALSCHVKRLKPNPLMYQECIHQLRTVPRKCLYVDDGGNGSLRGARNFSRELTLVMVKSICQQIAGDDPIYPHDYVIASVADLPALLQSLS